MTMTSPPPPQEGGGHTPEIVAELIEALVAAKLELWLAARLQWNLADFKNWAVVQQIDAALARARSVQP